jgi:uroporphyrin-III C-methyltransferase/precorrin-2 dehydrogenase/sirohydrochlorin ferrochelatase
MPAMRSLPLFHQIAGQPVIVLGDGEAAAAKRRLVERAGGIVVEDDDREARLAFIALDRPELATVRLRARGVLVNVTDRPDLCDFTVPSVLDRDPVLIAVGTGGASAGLAKHLRLRREALLPADLGKLAETLAALREARRARWPAADARRRALDRALAQGGPLDPLASGSADLVQTWLANPAMPVTETCIELAIASADPDDLTLRQARLLGTADCILFETGIASAILDRARADAVRLPLPHEGAVPEGLVLVLRSRGER